MKVVVVVVSEAFLLALAGRACAAVRACLWNPEEAFNDIRQVRVGESAMMTAGREAGLEGEFCEPGWSSPIRVGQPRLGECRVLRGPYLGDVSALCFLPSTPHSYLIAGLISI